MSSNEIIQVIAYLIILTLCVKPLGNYMANVFQEKENIISKILGPIEKIIYKLSGCDSSKEMGWKEYTFSLLAFNLAGFLFLMFLQLFQSNLPLLQDGIVNVPFNLALNTAVSFVTNTNWQAYSGENTMSYLTQMLGLGVQNFLSAGTGIAVLVVMARGFRNKQTTNLGNFWKDLVKSTLYILLPLSIVFSFILIQQGVVQNFANYDTITTIEGVKQVIPQGPAASQIAIKQLGTNGGGFFGVNSAHPFENPTPLTNFLEMLAILFLPAAFTYTYGKLVGTVKHGWTIFATMMILFLVGLSISLYSEYTYNPVLATSHVMEGKEMRFGMANSILWEVATTSASNGSVNAMHDSLSPLSGMVGMINIMLGEIIFGGVGAGLYGIIIFVILTVFISGLMVGRTPEYLGKKIEAFEIKMVMLGVLLPSSMILIFSAIACVTPIGLSSLTNKGPHGLSEILYAFSSAAGNNGSAFGGLSANTTFYNLSIAFAMLIGRFGVIIPILAIAGSMSNKKIAPTSEGTLSTSNFLFIFMLLSVIIIVGALTFFPALALGPIIEHILMLNAKSF